jgi:hypothetical protein
VGEREKLPELMRRGGGDAWEMGKIAMMRYFEV